jgi:hypothetical protein
MFWRRFPMISVAVLSGVVSSAWAQGPTVPAGVTRNYVFAPIGLGSGETASITVMNAATATSPGGGSAAPSCTGTISFSNSKGAIGTPTSFTMASGQFTTVTLPFASAGLSGIRGEIQGNVALITSTAAPTPCLLVASMETYDSTTGATHAVLSTSTSGVAGITPVGPIMFPLAAPIAR